MPGCLPRCALAIAMLVAATSAAQAPPRSTDDLAARFRQAHDARSIESMRQLVFWGRADEATRASFERQAAADFDLKVAGVSFQPLKPDETLQYTYNGVVYRPTLPPLGRLIVEFMVGPNSRVTGLSTSYLYGARDGIYYLLTAEPSAP